MSYSIILVAMGAFIAPLISACTGMAGGLILMLLLSSALTYPIAIALHGIIQILSTACRSYFLREHISFSYVLPFAMAVPLGSFLGIKTLINIGHHDYLQYLLLCLVLFSLFGTKKKIDLPSGWFFPLGLILGFLGPIVGTTGPLLSCFFLSNRWRKEEVVATKSTIHLVSHLPKISLFFHLESLPDFASYYWILFFLATIIGSKLGTLLLKRLKQSQFEQIFKVLLGICALLTLVGPLNH